MRLLRLICLLVTACCWTVPSSAAGTAAFDSEIKPLLDTYCYKCHGERRPKAGLNLAKYTNEHAILKDPKTWQTVLTHLRDQTMPPESKPQPSADERDKLTEWVEKKLDGLSDESIAKDPGRVVIHRLSRLEYNNTIRDLFGVDSKPADKFPPDGGGGGGFDNNADTLFVPPILMEKYLEAAGEILDAASSNKVFIAEPGAEPHLAAKKILDHFAFRAFRRPVGDEESKTLLKLYQSELAQKAPWHSAVKTALKAILVSPHFLFRIEKDREGAEPYRLNDYELATRLSYFLWSTMPDDQLFERAAQNKLHDQAVLEKEIRRMLRDPKAKVFAENFASQWLHVRDLHTSAQPDARKFPEFTSQLRDAMYAEPLEFFHALLKDDRSILECIDADYTYVNASLAKHYDLPGIEGDSFRRVSLTNATRGGFLGMASILTLTSYPLRTSPVLRGKWVLEEVLGTPPPPPPPMVKSLPQDDRPRDGLTIRQRLEEHRNKQECAACHKRLDPLGFALENFDPIGRWRTDIRGQPVDASATLPNGKQFVGPVELKKVLLERKDDFVRNLSEKMLAYALGRGLEYYDTPAVNRIMKELARSEYRSSTLIVAVATSYPFQYRRNNNPQVTQN